RPSRWALFSFLIPSTLLSFVDGKRKTLFIAFVLVAVIPSGSLLLADRGQIYREATVQTFPNEPELVQFFADSVGLERGRPFRGSITFWTAAEVDMMSIINLWVRSIPTTNEYSQLVTPQSLYMNRELFKKDITYDLNFFSPWVSSARSYDVLFKTLQAL